MGNQKPLTQLCPGDFSDAGNAERFSESVRDRVKWCDSLGWLIWNGEKWDQNEHAVKAVAMDFGQRMLDDAAKLYREEMKTDGGKVTVPERVKKYLRHAERTRSRMGIDSFLDLSKAYLHIPAADLDARWYELNTQAGIYDLRTGIVRPHDPAALHTKIAPYSPSHDGLQNWIDFLNLVHQSDDELIRYRQMRVGMQLFGRIFTEDLEIDIGVGKNGKSTLNNSLFKVFGDYSGTLDSDVLTTDRQNKGPALATLRGKRFVICGELEEGQRLSISFLKKIASTDPLTIEAKYRDPETVQPSHHIILYSNFLPKVSSNDAGTWRRLTVIPYRAVMPSGNDEIPNFSDLLVSKCGGAILQWAIDGAKMFFEAGCQLKQPQAVQNAVQDYRQSEDWLSAFIGERCLLDNPAAKTKASELYAEYHLFAQQNGEFPKRNNDFAKAMETAGFRKVLVRGKPFYVGIRVDYAAEYGEPPPIRNYG